MKYLILFVIILVYGMIPVRAHSVYVPDTIIRMPKVAEITKKDTSVSAEDRIQYNELKKTASKKKWTSALYSVLVSEPQSPIQSNENESLDEAFRPYTGRVINHIEIIILKPFGTDINNPKKNNPEVKADSSGSYWLNRIGNNLHIDSRHSIIYHNLLFKEGDAVNPYIFAETEAHLRNTGYIYDARIQIKPLDDQYVDILVVVRDVFSIGLDVHNISFKSLDIEIYDKNYLGLGSRFSIRVIHNSKYHQKWGYGIDYQYQNFFNKFINLESSYYDEITVQHLKLSAERPLQSNLLYYGQIGYYWQRNQLSESPWDSITPPMLKNFSLTLGRAFNFFGRESSKRFALSARIINNSSSFKDVDMVPDPLQYEYARSRTFLTRYSIYNQKYYRQYLVHNFGPTEDMSYGYQVSAQFGYSNYWNFFKGYYLSLDMSAGKLYDFGNVYVWGALGTHINRGSFQQGILRFNANYFTPLLHLGKNRFRQFLNLNYARELNPVAGLVDYIYFSTLSTMKTAYANNIARGTERFMVNMESDLFTTLNIIGFRFLFFSFIDAGWLKDSKNLFNPSNFHWGLGLGLRVRNDLLVFHTIELKIGYYPGLDQNFDNWFNFTTSNPQRSPSFIPTYPQEITIN